jgi:hypothetical protein
MKLANRYKTNANSSSFEGVLSQTTWQLVKRWGSLPPTSFLSVLVNARHPIMFSPEARKAFEELPHLYFGLREENPHDVTGSSHQRGKYTPTGNRSTTL